MRYVRNLVLVSALFAVPALLVGCGAADSAKDKAKALTGEALTKAKDTFLKPMTDKFEEIKKKIADLKGDEQTTAQNLFDQLQAKVKELKDAPADKWEEMKKTIEELYGKLKDMLKLS